MDTSLNLTGKREVFWDDYLIDQDKTTATHRVHQPKEAGYVMEYNLPWEGNSCDYHNFLVEPDGLIRMYYLGWGIDFTEGKEVEVSKIHVCYAESRDGLNWIKPKLGICEFDGEDTNIILDGRESSLIEGYDNFFVIRDENPNCRPGEKYKGIAQGKGGLWCYTSDDAIHFTKGWVITDKGAFDSLNSLCWDSERKIYHCWFRGHHKGDINGVEGLVREIRHIYSTDFKSWSEVKPIDFNDKEDYELYTNCISVYERTPQLFIGFPTRYVERYEWTANYDRLCGAAARKLRMRMGARIGLATTDCIFMCSRDGQKWHRYNEAFMRPGPENPENWVYGDCYPTVGILETPTPHGSETELSMYSMIGHFTDNIAKLMRYTIRKDGFVSLNAPYSGAVVTTKPFTFEGRELKLNFSTSARGHLYVTLTAEDGTTAESCEIFGDSCDRIIDFDKDLSLFAGKSTVMQIRMRDADLYSVKFD